MLAILGRALRRTRIVPSGSPPLYRILILMSVISSITQALDRQATVSVTSIAPTWFDWAFVTVQLTASLAVLAGLYMVDENKFHAQRLNDSLNLEFIGLAFLQTAILVNVTAIVFYYDRPPTGQGSWFQIGFWFWCFFRMWDIRQAIRKLTQT